MSDMVAKLQTLWDELLKQAEIVRAQDENIIINKDRSLVFQKNFEEFYDTIKDQNMTKEVVFLDRHKVASIIICAVIKTKVLEYKILEENKVFLGNYHLALSAGLSYLQYELNQILKESGKLPINRFTFPNALYGDKSYKDNLICKLCFSYEKNGLNVLDLADIMFLLEYINLLQNGISLPGISDS